MNRIDRAFSAAREEGRRAFIPYITAGDPTLPRTGELVDALTRAGADIIELGIPFSDPLADGKTNQEAAERALRGDVSLARIIELVRDIRTRCDTPLLFFTYLNPVVKYGIERFSRDAADAGVDGVLALDMPPEECDELKSALDAAGLHMIFLVAPTSTDERIKAICAKASGFIYYVSRTGVTGERASLSEDIAEHVAMVRAESQLPIAVGFGISTPDQVADVAKIADGVVVGSAIVRRVGAGGDTDEMVRDVEECVRSLTAGLRGGGEQE